jgi:hypothetical protein
MSNRSGIIFNFKGLIVDLEKVIYGKIENYSFFQKRIIGLDLDTYFSPFVKAYLIVKMRLCVFDGGVLKLIGSSVPF